MPTPAIRALEPRFVFDGAAAPAAAQAHSDAAAQSHGDQTEKAGDTAHAAPADTHSAAPAAATPAHETASTNGRHEIVVIDKGVADLATLLAGVPASAEVILIDSAKDGFDQLADALKGRSDIDAIHILSHGSAGDLRLGTGDLTAETIQGRYAADLAIIGKALTATGDLLIYGCDFAAGDVGARAAALLASATGADVAASNDATGATALGGDWDLEIHDGHIETGVVVSETAQRDWQHLLASATITVSGNPVVKDGNGTTINTTRASNGVNYLDVDSNVVGSTAFWASAGTVNGVNVSLRATVIAIGETDDAVSFATSASGGDASVLIRAQPTATPANNHAASVTIRWDLVRADNPSVAVVADVDFQIGDIDGVGGQPNTRESVTPSQTGLTSYALASTTDLVVDSSNDRIRVSGTLNETASPPDSVSIVRFDWKNVSNWQITYDLAANATTGQAAFQHDGDRSLTFNAGTAKSVPKVDLDGNDSSGATGNDYKATFTEKGSAVAVADTDPLVTNTAATVSSATIVLTNAQVGDRLNVGILPSGITATTTSDSGTITVTLTGDADPATYQTALRAITFDNTSSDPNTTDRLVKSHVTSDGVQGTSATTTVSVVAVDDAPVNTVPTARSVAEDASLIFSSGNGTAITVSDVDARSGELTTTLSVLHGVLSLGSTTGVSVTGNNSATVTVTGTVAAINAALNGTTYRGTQDYNGGDTLTVTSNDNGNTGTGGPLSDSDTVAITVTAVNDAPVLDLDASAAGTGYATTYSEKGAGVAIVDTDVSVSDIDSPNIASAKAVITNHQVGDSLSFAGTPPSGITATYDAATYTLTLTGSASKADYQTALQQIRYASTGQDPATVTRTIDVTVNDGALDSNVATSSVAFTAVDDAPVNAVPGAQTVAEDTGLVFSSGNNNAITVSDVDAQNGSLTTTLSAAHGTITLGSTSGVTVNGNGTGTVSLTGTVAAINAALNGTTYRGAQDYNGSDTLTVTTNDNGNTGTGGPLSDSDTVAITVTPVNDAPVLDLDASAAGSGYATTYSEKGAGVAIVDTDVSVSDVDNTNITSAKAVITNHQTGDSLSVTGTLPAGITANYDPATYTLTLTGSASKADYQTALQQIRYASTGQDPATVTRTIDVTVNDGALDSNVATSSISFTAVDDAPVNSVPGAQTVAEDTGLVFSSGNNNAITVSDVDAQTGTLTTTLSAAHGTITLGSTSGVTVNGNGTGTVSLTGTVAAINAALNGTTYRGAQDYNGSDTLTVTTNDNGNTGTGGPLTDSDTIAITVTPVNDAPVLDLDASAAGSGYATTYSEKGAGVAIVDTDVSVSDIDSPNIASAKAVITNHQAGDSLSFVGTPPSGITATYNAATYTLTLTGSASKADYQTALQQIRYASTGQDPATVTRTIDVTVNDGALDSNVATTTVTFDAVNDAPVNTLPTGQTLAEDTSLVFSTANGNRITVSDSDAGTGTLTTTVSVAHGTLTLGSASGVTVTNDRTGAVTLTGTAAAITAALDSTTYRPAADFNGTETLTVVTNDNGNTGSGGAKSDTDSVSITVTPVNDAPVNGVPAAQSVDEDTNLVFSSGNGNAITVSDVDAGAGGVTATLSVQHGTLTLGGMANVTVTGAGTGSVTLSGTVADVNAALNGTIYRGDADYNGPDTLTVTTDDGGNTGAGGPKSDTDTVGLTVRPVEDAPTNSVPAATQTVDEDTSLTFSANTGNGVSVADADGGTLTVTLSSAQGLLTLSRTTRLTFQQGDGTGDGSMRFTGTIADINAALEGLRFDPSADRNGAAQISLTTVDPEGATASSTIAVSITPVADIVPDSVTTNEDTAITFNALTGANGGSADNFEDPTRAVTAVSQGQHGSVAFQADGTLTYTPNANFNGTDSFTYTVTSGGTTETAIVTVTVQPVNDAPVLDLAAAAPGTGYSTSYTERAPGVAIVDTNVSVSDIDNANMTSAKAVVTNGQTGDTLAIEGTLPAGITARFDAATYTLTLTGAATKADYQTALQLVRFSSAERDPATVTRSIAVSVNDGALDSNVATTTIAFTAVNDAPVNGLPVAQTVAEDTPLVFSAANRNGITVSDADAGNGAITTTLSVLHGTLTLGSRTGVTVSNDGSGSVTLTGTVSAINAALDGTRYQAAADYNGADSLTIVTNDGGNTGTGGPQTDTDTLGLTVTPANDAPRAGTPPAIGSLDGDAVTGTDLGRYFSDVDGDRLSFSISGLPAGLTIDPATGIVSGTIDRSASRGGTNGDYAVTVTADDGNGGTASRSFTWRVLDPAPIARNDGAVTDAGTPASGSVLADNGNGADSDPDGDPLTVAAVNGSAAGVGQAVAGSAGGRFTVLADGGYRFDPGTDFADLAAGQTRTTRITYTIADGDGGTATAALTVTVTGRNDAPATLAPGDRAAGDGETVALPFGSQFPNPGGAALSYSATGLPPGLSIDPATGTVSGTIDHAASGATGLADYRVTITATDPGGAATSKSFTFRVTNPMPQAVDDPATTTEDRPVTVDVLANDTDSDGDSLVIVATGDAAPRAGHGQVTIADGKLVYTPDANFNGTDTITYAIVDENGGISTASVTVTVAPANDAPTAGTLPDQAGRDGAPVRYDISTRFRDPDTDPSVVQAPSGDRLTFTATGLPTGLSIDPATGLITGTLPNDASPNSRYAVTVTATDASGASVSRGFTWTVSDGAPNAAPDSATTRAGSPVLVAVTANDSDADGDVIRLVDAPGATTAAHGTVSVDPTTGLLTYTPDPGFSGTDTVVYTIADAQGARATGILTVTVTPVNQRPVAPETLPARNATDGESVRVPLGNLITDPEGAALAYTVTGLPPGLTIDPATGAITGTIDRDASGPSGRTTYVVTLTATDPGGLAVSRNFAWTVTNPAPSASDDAITTDEDTPVDVDVTGNDSDPDGDPLAVVPGSATAGHGTVTINPDGSLRYTPDRDFNGTDTIIYTITDGNGGFATASVSITINPVNDAPVFDPASPALADRAANDAETVSIPAGSAFSDVDKGDVLTFTATGLPPGLAIDPDTGLISGTIDPDASTRVPGGVYTITLTGTDLAGASATTRFTITVGNPAPVALDDAATVDEDGVLEGSVLGNDHDPDGDAIRVDPAPVAGPLHGRLDLRPDGTFTYTPDADFHGEDSFTYAVIDSDGGRSTATVHLTVASVNDEPTATADPVTTREDTPVDGRIVADDRDGDPLTYTIETPPASGRVTLRPDGSFTYTPGADFNGSDNFTVRVSDGQGGSILVTVPVAIEPVNDAPDAHADPLIGQADSVAKGQVVATDRDGDPLGFRLAGPPTNGTVVLAADGSYAYTPKAGFSGSDRFTVEVSDGNGGVTLVTVDVTVTPNPVLVPPPGAFFPIPGPVPFFEAPAAPPVLVSETGIVANGFILPAIAAIDSLGSVGDVILADGAVVAAVNGVGYLHGTTICIDHDITLDESDRIARLSWERFERAPSDDWPWFSPRPYLGRSLGFSLSTDDVGTGSEDLMVEAIRRPDTLAINLRNAAPGTAAVVEVRLYGIDGSPAPDWIESDGGGGFWGRPPAGTGLVALELEVVLQDGRVVRRPMTVDAETGEIRALPSTRRKVDPQGQRTGDPDATPRPEAPLFTAQLASMEAHAARDLTLIEHALSRAR